jgi:hypothetical protein
MKPQRYPGERLDTAALWFFGLTTFVLFWGLVYIVGHL